MENDNLLASIDHLRRRAVANDGIDLGLLMVASYRQTIGTGSSTNSIVLQLPGRFCFDTDLLLGSSNNLHPPMTMSSFIAIGYYSASLPSVGHEVPGPDACTSPPCCLSMVQALPSSYLSCTSSTDVCKPRLLTTGRQVVLPMRSIHIHNLPLGVEHLYEASSTAPNVMGRIVHFLCYNPYPNQHKCLCDQATVRAASNNSLLNKYKKIGHTKNLTSKETGPTIAANVCTEITLLTAGWNILSKT